jgi:hypothetical protein
MTPFETVALAEIENEVGRPGGIAHNTLSDSNAIMEGSLQRSQCDAGLCGGRRIRGGG